MQQLANELLTSLREEPDSWCFLGGSTEVRVYRDGFQIVLKKSYSKRTLWTLFRKKEGFQALIRANGVDIPIVDDQPVVAAMRHFIAYKASRVLQSDDDVSISGVRDFLSRLRFEEKYTEYYTLIDKDTIGINPDYNKSYDRFQIVIDLKGARLNIEDLIVIPLQPIDVVEFKALIEAMIVGEFQDTIKERNKQ